MIQTNLHFVSGSWCPVLRRQTGSDNILGLTATLINSSPIAISTYGTVAAYISAQSLFGNSHTFELWWVVRHAGVLMQGPLCNGFSPKGDNGCVNIHASAVSQHDLPATSRLAAYPKSRFPGGHSPPRSLRNARIAPTTPHGNPVHRIAGCPDMHSTRPGLAVCHLCTRIGYNAESTYLQYLVV